MHKNQQEIFEVKLKDLQGALDDLRARWPAHSVKPEMIIQLEDLEEEIATLQNLLDEEKQR
jgi:hypothetical protein